MTTFDERERGFESHFALSQDQEFRAVARRNRLLGEWAAERLGKSGEERDAYVLEIIRSDLEHPGEEDVYRRLAADLQGHADEAEIRSQMARLLHVARQKVAEDTVGHN
jgi:hypothetical protein